MKCILSMMILDREKPQYKRQMKLHRNMCLRPHPTTTEKHRFNDFNEYRSHEQNNDGLLTNPFTEMTGSHRRGRTFLNTRDVITCKCPRAGRFNNYPACCAVWGFICWKLTVFFVWVILQVCLHKHLDQSLRFMFLNCITIHLDYNFNIK